ncbi:DUF6146 family protein [Flavobacterium sp.]|uniref:DUF6146 family protein n=1 Tax=Flavobacterium sp. TaxID=239 RepID=UPI0035B4EE3A
MSKLFFIGTILFTLVFSCQSNKNFSSDNNQKLTSDTIRIVNEELDYEVIIIDGGFTSWFNSYARPRGFYTQEYLETRNRFWVLEWNNRARNTRYLNLYEMPINYETNTNYGFEVNYMLYNYLVYFQITNKQQLGGYIARP